MVATVVPSVSRADSKARNRGFTLVEVLIALVILLIGIYAMMAIFPRGYSAMTASEMRTIGSQLAEAELARWKLAPETLPDAIVATDYDGALIAGTLYGTGATDDVHPNSVSEMLLVWNSGAVPLPLSFQYHGAQVSGETFLRLDSIPGALYQPENLTPCQYDGVSSLVDPTRTQDPRKSAHLHRNWEPHSLYLPRTVIGEQIDIRRLNSQAAGVPFYLLSHAPLDVLRYEDDPETAPTDKTKAVYLDLYDARAWEYQEGGATAQLATRQYSADSAGRMYFGPRDLTANPPVQPGEHVFKVDYTALVDNVPTRIYGARVECTAAGVSTQALDPVPSDLTTMRVFEALVPLTTAERAVFNDPAQVVNWPRNAYYINAETSITGKIEFCPLVQVDPQPNDITLVKADYRVMDWQILVFDVEVPSDGVVRLPVTNLKGPNFVNYPRQPRPQEVARGVRKLYTPEGELKPYRGNDPVTWAYLVAVDRQNGDILTESEVSAKLFGLSANPYERRTRVQVDFRTGTVYFNYDSNKVQAGTYNALVDTPNRSGRNYRIFCRAEADWAVQLMPAARVYARSSNYPGGTPVGGQTSSLLSYAWRASPTPTQIYFPLSESGQSVAVDYYTTNGTYVEGEVHTIGGPTLTRDLGAQSVWVCALSEPLKQSPNEFGPVNVRGLSVRARAVWVNRGRQSSLEDVAKLVNEGKRGAPDKSLEETWRQVIVTTFITRTPI